MLYIISDISQHLDTYLGQVPWLNTPPLMLSLRLPDVRFCGRQSLQTLRINDPAS